MKNRCLFALLAVVPPAFAHADVIYLNDGRVVQADVLKTTSKDVIVDLGFDVLRIPKENITRIEKAAEAANSDSDTVVSEHLYSTANLPVIEVAELTQRLEDGVVMVKTPGGRGSGFIIHKDGYLITNFHVIEGETRITLNLFRREGGAYRNEKIEDVRIIAVNPFLDVALLKFDPRDDIEVTVMHLCSAEEVTEGDTVFAIGNPLGLERTVSQGIVSKKNRRESNGLLYLQTTTQINPGNSGGPLFNTRGEVVGVTNAGYLFAEGLNYAIPIRYVIDFLQNRDAYTYDLDNPSSGHQYIQPAARVNKSAPDFVNTPPSPPASDSKPDRPRGI